MREWACSDLGTNAQSFIILSFSLVCSHQEVVWVRVCSGFCSFDWTLHGVAPDATPLAGGVLHCIKAVVFCLSRSHGRFAVSLVVRDLGNASKILCLDGANHRLQERLCVGLRGARRHQRNDDALNARGLRVKEGSIDWSSICRRTEDASSEQSNPRVCVLSRALWGLRSSLAAEERL